MWALMSRPKTKASCHPERWNKARGMCSSCYYRWHRDNSKVRATCHPDRVHFAKGLCRSCYRREDYRLNGGKDKRYVARLRTEYGLTTEDYENLQVAQQWRCAICEKEKQLIVDHNHSTGKVRGLLCNPCNQALGLFKDDPARLRSAIAYLEESL